MCTAWEKHILQINRHSNLSTSLCYSTKKNFSKSSITRKQTDNVLKLETFFFTTPHLRRKVLLDMVVVGEKYDLFPPIFCVTFIIYGLMHDYFLAKVKLYYYCWWRMWSLLELSIRHEPIVWWDKTLVLTSCIHNRWIVQIGQYGKPKPQVR